MAGVAGDPGARRGAASRLDAYRNAVARVYLGEEQVGRLEVSSDAGSAPLVPPSSGAPSEHELLWRLVLEPGIGHELGVGAEVYGIVRELGARDEEPGVVSDTAWRLDEWDANLFSLMGHELRLEWLAAPQAGEIGGSGPGAGETGGSGPLAP